MHHRAGSVEMLDNTWKKERKNEARDRKNDLVFFCLYIIECKVDAWKNARWIMLYIQVRMKHQWNTNEVWTLSALKYRASILIVHYFYSWMNNFIGLCNRLNKCSYFICLLLTFWVSLTLALTTTLVIVLYYSTI